MYRGILVIFTGVAFIKNIDIFIFCHAQKQTVFELAVLLNGQRRHVENATKNNQWRSVCFVNQEFQHFEVVWKEGNTANS